MFPLLFLVLFISVPLVEIAVFIEVGDRIGLWPTIGVVVLTAVIGTAMLRAQGLSTVRRVQEQLASNQLPVRELFDGLCLLVAGALLLTPGFVTDSLGFLLFVPPARGWMAGRLVQAMAARGNLHMHGSMGGDGTSGPGTYQSQHGTHTHPDPFSASRGSGGQGPIIDGDFEAVDPDAEARPSQQRPALEPKDRNGS